MQKTTEAPPDSLPAFSKKLGGEIVKITNTTLAVEGKQLRVNVVTAATDDDAETIYKAILKMHGNPAFCIQRGCDVIEFTSNDYPLVKRAHYALGLKPPTIAYRVSLTVAAIDKIDYMQSNEAFNLVLRLADAPKDSAASKRLQTIVSATEFGRAIHLRSLGVAAISIAPKPTATEQTTTGGITAYRFDPKALFKQYGIPYATVSATITVTAFHDDATDRKADRTLTSPTPFWPSDDARIKQIAQEAVADTQTDEDKVAAILNWVAANVKYGGDVTGSRYGVKKVLAQGYGHCWDSSDVFVTLCRAAGIPCRQVGGWLYGQTGHIWAEVLIAGKGWRQVDPQANARCDTDYIPWFTTENGEMPIVYMSLPRIEIVKP